MFQAGDVVQLKAGGPMMTVERATNRADGVFLVVCTWFDGHGEVQSKSFIPETLKAASPAPDCFY
jgi:uncharacterized protein YodC (DUF2158 family)